VVLADNDEYGSGSGDIFGATLAPGATAFTQGNPLFTMGAGAGTETLTVDPHGDAWIASGGAPESTNCTAVAFRPAGGAGFTTTYEPPCPDNNTGLEVQGLAAGADATAAMVSQQPTANGRQERLAVQVGRDGHFGRPIELDVVPMSSSSPFLDPRGVVADRTGRFTVAWRHCSGAGSHCAIEAVTGTRTGRFGKPQTVVPPTPRAAITAAVADGSIAVERCVKHRRCTLSISTIGGRGRSGRPRVVATGVQLQDFIGDDHGDLLLLYRRGGALWATPVHAGARRFGPSVRLSATVFEPNIVSTVTAVYGPDNEAMVAWSGQGHTFAAVYSN
jgi:hypothetical protein